MTVPLRMTDDDQQQPPMMSALTAPLGPLQQPDLSSFQGSGAEPQPKVTNPRMQREEQLQNKMSAYDNPTPPHGVMGHIAHGLNILRNIGETAFAPGIAAADPTSMLYKSLERSSEGNELKGLQSEDTADTKNAQAATTANSESALRTAQTKHAEAETDKLGEPEDPDWQHFAADDGFYAYNPKTQEVKPLLSNGKPILPPQKEGKEANRDDRAIAINQKPPEERSPEEQSYLRAYDHYIQQTKTDPGIERAIAFSANRPIQIIDPTTGDVHYMAAGQAEKTNAAAPGSIGFSTEKGVAKDFASGTSAKNLTAYNTAIAHLGTLRQTAAALNNGDVQLVNRLGNEFAKQTGATAPTNFEAVKGAVAGEIGKTFKGGQATDAEIKEMNNAISGAQSPQQLSGVIDTYAGLMASKRDALKGQYQSGMSGKPNFGGEESPAVPKVGEVIDGHRFKGGNPGDKNSWEKVSQ